MDPSSAAGSPSPDGLDQPPAARLGAEAALLGGILQGVVANTPANQGFMDRATRAACRDLGIGQFLVIGAGFVNRRGLQAMAAALTPGARMVYVEKDPGVLAEARAGLVSGPGHRVAFVEADTADPIALLKTVQGHTALDLTRPVAVYPAAQLPLITDNRVAYGLLRCLLDQLPRGTALVLAHPTGERDPDAWQHAARLCAQAGIAFRTRSRDEVARFFTGLGMLCPGLVLAHHWWPPQAGPTGDGVSSAAPDATTAMWAGVGVKTGRLLPIAGF